MLQKLYAEIKRATIAAGSSGDNILVAAVTGKKIRVLSFVLIGYGTAVDAYFRDNADSPVSLLGDSTHKIKLDRTGTTGPPGLVVPVNDAGWFETTAAKALMLNLSTAQTVCGCLTYALVDG